MATRIYQAGNWVVAASGVTAAPAKMTTSTAIKTLMQLNTPSTMTLEVIEWGISFDGSAAATPGVCELVDTVAIGATSLTTYAAADITKVSQVGTTASGITLGAGQSGIHSGSSTEGSVVAARQFDTQLLPPTAPYIKQFPLERGPTMLQSEFLRIRVTFGTAINALAYIVWSE
jgi:hypothetical protein